MHYHAKTRIVVQIIELFDGQENCNQYNETPQVNTASSGWLLLIRQRQRNQKTIIPVIPFDEYAWSLILSIACCTI